MDKSVSEIVSDTYEVRQEEVDRRHAADTRNANLRKRLAMEMSAGPTIPEDLGCLRVSAETFPEIKNVIEQGKTFVRETKIVHGRKNRVFPQEAYADPAIVDSPLFKLALDPTVISTVSKYLGFVPILTTADYWYNPNKHITDGTQNGYHASLYHLDWADNRIIKLFVHCSDVTDTNGPLHLLDPVASTKLRTALNYRYARQRNTSTDVHANDGLYIDDKLVASHLGPDFKSMALTGKEGSAYFADTARSFHYGGRNTEKGQPRLIGILLYLRPGALKISSEHGDTAPFRHLVTPSMSLAQRLVLGAEVDET